MSLFLWITKGNLKENNSPDVAIQLKRECYACQDTVLFLQKKKTVGSLTSESSFSAVRRSWAAGLLLHTKDIIYFWSMCTDLAITATNVTCFHCQWSKGIFRVSFFPRSLFVWISMAVGPYIRSMTTYDWLHHTSPHRITNITDPSGKKVTVWQSKDDHMTVFCRHNTDGHFERSLLLGEYDGVSWVCSG